MMKIDVNSDMGEGFGVYQLCDDEALMQVVSSANIACGFHAGDPAVSMEILTTLSSLHQIRAQLDLLKEIPCKTLQLPSFLPRP